MLLNLNMVPQESVGLDLPGLAIDLSSKSEAHVKVIGTFLDHFNHSPLQSISTRSGEKYGHRGPEDQCLSTSRALIGSQRSSLAHLPNTIQLLWLKLGLSDHHGPVQIGLVIHVFNFGGLD